MITLKTPMAMDCIERACSSAVSRTLIDVWAGIRQCPLAFQAGTEKVGM